MNNLNKRSKLEFRVGEAYNKWLKTRPMKPSGHTATVNKKNEIRELEELIAAVTEYQKHLRSEL